MGLAQALPGRERAAQNEVLRAFQPCPLSGKPDIGGDMTVGPLLTHCCRRRSSRLALRYSYSINSSALSRIDVGTSRPSALGSHIEYGLVFKSNFARSSAAISLAKA